MPIEFAKKDTNYQEKEFAKAIFNEIKIGLSNKSNGIAVGG